MGSGIRRVALVVAVGLVALALGPLTSPSSADAQNDFTVIVFPHSSTDVRFSNDWGDPRPDDRTHEGTDIFSPRGSGIVAVADGFVTGMGSRERSGYYINIRHGNGWTSHYFHLNNDSIGTDNGKGGRTTAFAPDIEVGDFVFAGQVIGYVGDSGNAEHTTPHTHFEIRKNNRPVNPYPYLADAYEVRQLLDTLDRRGVPISR